MTVAVETELRSRITVLESEVALLKKQLERSELNAALRRGRDEADRGLMTPARDLVAKIRANYGLPNS